MLIMSETYHLQSVRRRSDTRKTNKQTNKYEPAVYRNGDPRMGCEAGIEHFSLIERYVF